MKTENKKVENKPNTPARSIHLKTGSANPDFWADVARKYTDTTN